MSGGLYSRLRPVSQRQRISRVFQAAAYGWLMGSAFALLAALARFWLPDVPAWLPWSFSGAGLVLGAICGSLIPLGWQPAARSVDRHYGFKDRVTSALAFLNGPKLSDVHVLQIADTLEHMDRVDAREVVPYRMPRPLPYALAAQAILLGLLFWTSPDDVQAALAPPLPDVLQEAQRLEETMLPELEELAARAEDERLEELIAELKELVQEMQQPGVDQREALAKLSLMEAAIAEAKGEFNLEQVDASLQELAEALSPAAAMKGASAALSQGKYDEAANELEKWDPSQLSRKEAKAVSENLRKVAKKMKDRGQGRLCKAAGELTEGLDNENESQCKEGACQLAGLCRSHSLRKAVGECLACQLSLLSECKGNCQGKNGGQKVAKSTSPSQNWGRGESNKPLGEESTSLGSTLNRQEITGQHGDGPSQREVTHSPEGRQEASREYREKYAQYRRMSEAVLESEPLPLGHRQTIRKYFESIRPQASDSLEPAVPQ